LFIFLAPFSQSLAPLLSERFPGGMGLLPMVLFELFPGCIFLVALLT
jgi:hypothetical protein